MARVRRNWTPKEDELLRRAVRTAEAQQRPLLWRELAKAVPGRSNKDCRRRWWNSLADGNAKGPWAEEEDERLIAAVQTYGTNWTRVAQEVKSRGSDQCSSHWSHVLDPNINYCDWTEEEDADLLHEVLAYGTRWAHIASCHNPCRTTLALKNRYSTLRLKSENRNRSRQQSCEGDFHHHHHNSSSGSAILFASSQPSDQRLPLLEDRTPNPSDTTSDGGPSSQARDEDDEDEDSSNNNEDEEEDSVVEAEEGDVIHAWLDEARHISNGGGGGDAESSLRLGAMHIQVPDVAALSSSWDVWTKFGGLPTPHGHQHQHHHHHHAQGGGGSNSSGLQQMSGTEAVGPGAIDVESYLQLGSPMALLNGASSAQEPSPLSERCFYTNGGGGGGEDAHCARTTADQTTSSSSYPLHDNTRCRQHTPVSTSPATLVSNPAVLGSSVDMTMENNTPSAAANTSSTNTNTTMGGTGMVQQQQQQQQQQASHATNGWGMGPPSNATSCPSPPSPWPQQSPSSSSISLGSGPLSKFRVSITTTCDQEQLMNIITQLSQYGTAPSINVQKE